MRKLQEIWLASARKIDEQKRGDPMCAVVCSRCGQVICHLDYDPDPSVHYICPKGVRHEDKNEDVATSHQLPTRSRATSLLRHLDDEDE